MISSRYLSSSGLLLVELASEAALQQSMEVLKVTPGEQLVLRFIIYCVKIVNRPSSVQAM
jgi:hypothetical protein